MDPRAAHHRGWLVGSTDSRQSFSVAGTLCCFGWADRGPRNPATGGRYGETSFSARTSTGERYEEDRREPHKFPLLAL
jgi:hypothetical protein